MRPKRRPARIALPVGAMMALVMAVVAVALMFGAFQQQSANEQRSADVLSRDRALDQREQELDQRRAELDRRDDAAADREKALAEQAGALDGRQAALEQLEARQDADAADLAAREQALGERLQALSKDQAALAQAQKDLSAREQALKDAQARTDEKLADYAALQKAVDEALGARARIASRLAAALKPPGGWAVGGDGAASMDAGALFDGASAALSEDGRRALDAMLPAWCQALEGESVPVISVEVLAASEETQALDLAARRALAILQYAQTAPALSPEARQAMLEKGASGARAAAGGQSRAVFRFYLNYDALRAARAG